MKAFIDKVKEKDQRIIDSYAKKELRDMEKICSSLEDQHDQIRRDISKIDYLLDSIDKYKINSVLEEIDSEKKRSEFKKWINELRSEFESIYTIPEEELTPEDIKFLKTEKSKLLGEKKRLVVEEHHINVLLAKSIVYLMDTRETICKEITGGHSIADVGEKLLEHFGKQLKEETTYNEGRRKIIHYLEDKFQIESSEVQILFSILEKSHVLIYKIDLKSIDTFSDYNVFDDYTNPSYSPLFGVWHINA